MRLGSPIDPRLPWVRELHDLQEARALSLPGQRARELKRLGRALGDELRQGPHVLSVRTLPLTTLLYPTRYAFNGAMPLPLPYVVLTHRALLVQVMAEGACRNILFNPTDYVAARQTPFFRALVDRYGEWATDRLLTTQYGSVQSGLSRLGLEPADIDVIAFDHFHTQDLRPLLGTVSGTGEPGRAARFPNALLLAPRREWLDWDDLHPLQRAWFIAEGKKGVAPERVVLTEHDLLLGDGCMLLRTVGHTSGNQTLFVHAAQGVFGCSENGCSTDCWSPAVSRVPGLRAYASHHDVEVVLNANTPELGAEQYSSMLLEASVVDPVPFAPQFRQMFPSSEVTPSLLSPGLRPSVVLGERTSGTVVQRG